MPPLEEENISDAESTGASIPFENSDKKEEAEDAKDAAKNEMNGDDDDDQDDEGDDEEDVYIVEKIMDHEFGGKGGNQLFLKVKWNGYEKEEDMTWEPEAGVTDGAPDVVDDYYKKIGGRPVKPVKKRKSRGADNKPTPEKTEPKKRRKSKAETIDPDDMELTTLPEKGKWGEKEVKGVQTIEQTPEGYKALLLLTNGKKASVLLGLCNQRCPQKMLKFYEAHLSFSPLDKKPE